MKDIHEDPELENLLGRLSPAAPPAELMERLRAARPECHAPEKVVSFPGRRWLPLAAAACLALVLALALQHGKPDRKVTGTPGGGDQPAVPHPAPGPAGAKSKRVPLEAWQHLMEVRYCGMGEDQQQRPVKLYQTTWLDEVIYRDGDGDGRVRESTVRQEILPVSVKTL